MRNLFLILSFLVILISGCLGFKSVSACDDDPNINTDSEYMLCYHTSAITHAYLGQKAKAEGACELIWDALGSGKPESDDTAIKAEMTANACYYDIALITHDAGLCNGIHDLRRTSRVDTGLKSESVLYKRCITETGRLERIETENYHEVNKDTICSIIFLLPLILLFAVKRP